MRRIYRLVPVLKPKVGWIPYILTVIYDKFWMLRVIGSKNIPGRNHIQSMKEISSLVRLPFARVIPCAGPCV